LYLVQRFHLIARRLHEILQRAGAVQIQELATRLTLDRLKSVHPPVVKKRSGVFAPKGFDHGAIL
jgi:hypothetical protein